MVKRQIKKRKAGCGLAKPFFIRTIPPLSCIGALSPDPLQPRRGISCRSAGGGQLPLLAFALACGVVIAVTLL
ncbi:hypothetical protein EN851_27140 [Mesorhizobium sp. M8A.F.Ca.ET.208.01.1.1]|uniref:hypothetical protein n=1 Tax=unclassified Mesorhizobium TaxID=325217 RepID=UPI001093D0E3|nr:MULTISPECIES: hypothetical protein [unclassified Mesorhizobium]TGQ87698.1 hypothetical protein EN851_27140 [Mesorhizobium sp. M8A.F.Ca.ET.208.01.1.1]TGT49428.1 hypothetical protein EN810_27040 [Mesorhizobium sp. M8A.F.Ca.ET.167.01.1.1]